MDDVIFEAHMALVIAIFRRAMLDARRSNAEALAWLLAGDDGTIAGNLNGEGQQLS